MSQNGSGSVRRRGERTDIFISVKLVEPFWVLKGEKDTMYVSLELRLRVTGVRNHRPSPVAGGERLEVVTPEPRSRERRT